MAEKNRLIYQLNQARHTMMKSLDLGCRQALDVSMVQLSALMILQEKNGCLMKDLAKTLMLDKSAVTGLAKRMQAKALITKVPCPNDSRASLLVVSEQGHKALAHGLKLLVGVNEQITSGFNEQELETVSRFLEHLTSTFSKGSQ